MDELDPRFKIRAPLRCDGIGRLDCAEDLESGMRMAVRWLPLEANGTAAVEACEQLPSHPTLPRIRQIGRMGASAYVAMEFPDGNLLATRAGEALDGATLIGITAQIADALATIHSQEVFHGEMSADSVLLVKSPSEKAFLWDMPLVIANRLTDRRGEERLMTQLVKTAPYLAPERARGAKAGAESDVYALGAILCVAGGSPLPVAETTLGVVHAVVSGTWQPRVPRAIPEPMRSMLERMVAREPSHRPTAREVADLFVPPMAAHPTLREMAAVVIAPPVLMPAVTVAPAVKPVKAVDSRLTRATAPAMPVIDAQVPSPLEQSMLDAAEAQVADPLEAPDAESKLAAAGIPLTDNVSVSQELHAAGAVLLSAEEAALLPTAGRKLPVMMVAVMVVLLGVLAMLAINLARSGAGSSTPVIASPLGSPGMRPTDTRHLKQIPAMAPSTARIEPRAVDTSDDDELSALTPRAKKAHKRVAKTPELAQESSPEVAPQPANNQGDFGFLEEEPELKRPSF